MGSGEIFPRELSAVELELLLWVLPGDRPGYAEYRKLVERWKVVGMGRRGEGDYVLGEPGQIPDVESPLPQILASGFVESVAGNLTVGVRERTGDQFGFEITGQSDTAPLQEFRWKRRWTFSGWLPSQPCPACDRRAREVALETASGQRVVLAICAEDRHIWVYNSRSGINHLIPVTGFYNELMFQKKIQDPRIVFNSSRLFSDLGTFSDLWLSRAFLAYNRFRTKVAIEEPLLEKPEKSLSRIQRAKQWLAKHKNEGDRS